MPGTPLALEYPEVGDSVAEVLQKFSDNFQTLETDLEAKVTEGEIQVGAALDLNGYNLTDAGAVVLSENGVGAVATAGALSAHEGVLYFADPTGAVAITDGAGGLNAAAIGGITGEYGGAFPAVVDYDSGTDAYSFTADGASNYSQLVASDLKMPTSGGGSLQIVPQSSISSAKTLTFNDLPASTSFLTISSAGVIAPAASVAAAQTVTGTMTITAAAVTTLTVTNLPKHGTRTKGVPLLTGRAVSASTFTYAGIIEPTSTTCTIEFPISEDVGARIQNATVYAARSGAGTMYIYIGYRNTAGAATTYATNSSAGIGAVTLTATPGAPATIPVATSWYIQIVVPNVADDVLYLQYTYDVP